MHGIEKRIVYIIVTQHLVRNGTAPLNVAEATHASG